MVHPDHIHLSRRERQIIDALYSLGESSVADVQARLPGEPAYSTVRAQLGTLVSKGHLVSRREGTRYLYSPVVEKNAAGQSAARRLVETFFSGSSAQAVVGLLSNSPKLDDAELDAIEEALDQLRRQQDSLRKEED